MLISAGKSFIIPVSKPEDDVNKLGTRHRFQKFAPHNITLSLEGARRRSLFMLGYQRYQTRGKLDTRSQPWMQADKLKMVV